MTIFMCEACGFEIDYDESPYECIECEEYGELMTGVEMLICDVCKNNDAEYTIEVYKNNVYKESYTLCHKCKYFYIDKIGKLNEL